jgi:hypothetical protein
MSRGWNHDRYFWDAVVALEMCGVVGPIVTMAAMVCFELIFVSEFTLAALPLRPKNVILQDIMIIFISFKDADLLYYLLIDVFTRQRQVWGTMVAVERGAAILLPWPTLCGPAKS